MVRDPDAGRFPFGQHHLGNQLGSFQNKCIGPRQKSFHGSVGIIGNLGIKTDMFQVGAYETKGFVFLTLFNLIDTFNRLFVHDVASDAIKRIRGIGNDSPIFQMRDNALNESFLGIYWVDLEEHYSPVKMTVHGCKKAMNRSFFAIAVFSVRQVVYY